MGEILLNLLKHTSAGHVCPMFVLPLEGGRCPASKSHVPVYSSCGNPSIPWYSLYRWCMSTWIAASLWFWPHWVLYGFMHVYAPKCACSWERGWKWLQPIGFWGTPCSDKPIRSISNTAAKRLGYWRLNPRSIPYSHICVGQIPFNYPKSHQTRQWHGKSLILL